MIPRDHVGLLVADTRRATQWELGLRTLGVDVVRVETRGEDADKGAWQIAVPRSQSARARTYVSAVLRGDHKLPSAPRLSRSGMIALVAIVLILALMVALGVARS